MLAHNMYIYCANNPVNLCDPNGNNPIIVEGVKVVVYFIAAYLLADIVAKMDPPAIDIQKPTLNITTKKKAIANEISKIDAESKKSNNTVYTLTNKSGVVQYVGRTTNYDARISQHLSANSARKDLIPGMKMDNLTRVQARGVEQIWIIQFSTLNRGNPINNQINGIAWDNPNYASYIQSATQLLFSESSTYVGP